MANDDSRFTRRGFLTLWALFFLASVSLVLILVMAGQSAREQSTHQLIKDYNRSTSQLNRTVRSPQQASKPRLRTVKPADSRQRLLE